MRSYKIVFSVLCGLLLFSGSALGLTITDVGSIDTVKASGNIGNSAAAELAWIQTVLGDQYTINDTYDLSASDWTVVDGYASSVFAWELNGTPEFFFVKLGIGGTSIQSDHWLYTNLDQKAWAVLDTSVWGTANNINIGRVSHLGEIGGVPVPEPATMLLLGCGLIGMVAFSRRKMFKK